MSIVRTSSIATVAVATGLVLTAGAGGAVAGAMITGKQIKNNTVTTQDIRNGSLTGTDVADRSLTGTDVADGSLGAADLAGSVRSRLGDLTISGSVSKTGVVKVLRAPAGVTVQAQVNVGGNLGNTCVRVSGAKVDPTNAVIIATPDYGYDDTSTSGSNAIVEATSNANNGGCTGGFRVQTLRRTPDGSIVQDDEGYLFQIN